jgi:hypothetical protein
MIKISFIFGIVFLVWSMMACLPSAEEEQSYIYPSSSFKYKQNQYNLKKGFIINYGKRNRSGGYNINLNLISADLEIIEEKGVIVSSKGFGHLLFFEMFSDNAKELESGIYPFDSLYTGQPGTFDSGKGFLDMDIPQKTSQTFQISSGALSVINKKNGEYEITIDCKTTRGDEVRGFYTGSLRYFDYSLL